jgi:hypothetical protein
MIPVDEKVFGPVCWDLLRMLAHAADVASDTGVKAQALLAIEAFAKFQKEYLCVICGGHFEAFWDRRKAGCAVSPSKHGNTVFERLSNMYPCLRAIWDARQNVSRRYGPKLCVETDERSPSAAEKEIFVGFIRRTISIVPSASESDFLQVLLASAVNADSKHGTSTDDALFDQSLLQLYRAFSCSEKQKRWTIVIGHVLRLIRDCKCSRSLAVYSVLKDMQTRGLCSGDSDGYAKTMRTIRSLLDAKDGSAAAWKAEISRIVEPMMGKRKYWASSHTGITVVDDDLLGSFLGSAVASHSESTSTSHVLSLIHTGASVVDLDPRTAPSNSKWKEMAFNVTLLAHVRGDKAASHVSRGNAESITKTLGFSLRWSSGEIKEKIRRWRKLVSANSILVSDLRKVLLN